jgi:hypothetical protein
MSEPYNGPYNTRDEAAVHPEVRRIHAIMQASPDRGTCDVENQRVLKHACEAADVQLGTYDLRIMRWLAGWEPEICIVVAGLIARAAARSAATQAGPLAGWEPAMKQALRDATRWCERQAGDWPAGQIGLYRALARELGVELGPERQSGDDW